MVERGGGETGAEAAGVRLTSSGTTLALTAGGTIREAPVSAAFLCSGWREGVSRARATEGRGRQQGEQARRASHGVARGGREARGFP